MKNHLLFSRNPIKHKRLISYSHFSTFENKSIMLLEKMGIASFEYNDLIEMMIDELNYKIKKLYDKTNYVKSKYNGHNILICDYKFSISDKITKQFKGINNFIINVEVKDIIGDISKYDFNITGDSEYYMLDEDDYDIDKDEIKNVKIVIKCYSINQSIIENDFYESFIHEYNHFEEDRNRLIKHKELLKTYSKQTFSPSIYRIHSNDKIKRLISRIEYMLWDKSEFNAWATSGYSYLKGIKSKRENFHNDIRGCEAYMHYKTIKDNIDDLYKLNDIDIWMNVYKVLNKKELKLDDKNFNKKINNVKNKFIIQSKFLLNKFWKRLCRNATLYYNEQR